MNHYFEWTLFVKKWSASDEKGIHTNHVIIQHLLNHLVKLNAAIPRQPTATNGLNLSPTTAALRSIPLNPDLCDSMNVGQIART